MSKGIICFAVNNDSVDYLKQARFLAKRAKEYLNLPVTVITNEDDNSGMFDQVINIESSKYNNIRRYYNGSDEYEVLNFQNDSRPLAYELSPYEETILVDTDYIICSDKLLMPFREPCDFMIHDRSIDLAPWRGSQEFWHLNDAGVKFYWATCVYFKKTEQNKIFFDLLKHIQENWDYYNLLYEISHPMYRNDYAFSIAIHIFDGYQQGNWASIFPRPIYHSLDKDYLYKIDNDTLTLLTQKHTEAGEYTLTQITGTDVHVMNKYSLEELIDV